MADEDTVVVADDNGATGGATPSAVETEAAPQVAAEAGPVTPAETEIIKPDVWALLNDVDDADIERQIEEHPKLKGVMRRREQSVQQRAAAAAAAREQQLARQWVTQQEYVGDIQELINEAGEVDAKALEPIVGRLRQGAHQEGMEAAQAAIGQADALLVAKIGKAKISASLFEQLERARASADLPGFFATRGEMLAEAHIEAERQKWIEQGRKEERERLRSERVAANLETAGKARAEQRQPANVNGTAIAPGAMDAAAYRAWLDTNPSSDEIDAQTARYLRGT